MRKAFLKAILCAVFCSGSIVYLSGCVNPVDLASFAKGKDVAEIIDQSLTVRLSDDSVPGLKEGNKKITGLKPGKYYMVEEWLADRTTFVGFQFVRASGERSENLANIGTVSGEEILWEITGLTNRYYYRVSMAEPLPGDVPYKVLLPPAAGGTAPNTGGVITLPGPENDNDTIIYTLTPPPPAPPYDIAQVPISPAGSTSSANRSGGDIITLIGPKTITDYVFFDDVILNFYFLRVAAEGQIEPPEPGENGNLNVTVSFTLNADNKTFTLSANSLTFSKAVLETTASKVITVTLLDTANVFVPASIKWTLGGTTLTWSSATMSIDFADPANIDLLVKGIYTITIEAKTTADGVPYSSSIELEITP